MKFDFDKIIDWIKENKKIAIPGGIAIVLLLIILIGGKLGGSSPDFMRTISDINSESYTADGTINISNKKISININKAEEDIAINLKSDENEYPNLYVKAGTAIYLNNDNLENQSGLLTINTLPEAEDVVFLDDVLIDAISNSEGVTFSGSETSQKLDINTTEGWATFWNDIYNAINDNMDSIAAGYATPEIVTEALKTRLAEIKKMADTNTIANTLTCEVITEENNYSLNFDLTMDTSIIPSFINADNIDSNKLKVTGTIVFTISDAATIKKPSGSIHAADTESINNFLTNFSNSIFAKSEYVSFTQVSVTNNTVSATYNLGETIEKCQILFNNNGVSEASWYITSTNETIIDSYISKYKKADSTEKDFIKFSKPDGTFGLNIVVSDDGIESFNKIARNSKDMGDFLNSPKGGDIIV